MQVNSPGNALPAYLQDAVDFIVTNLAEPLTVDDIAAAVGVSNRTLQWQFQRHLGVAVMAFVNQRRLEKANRELLSADEESMSVTAAAMNSGFAHLGRFSSVYRKCFGEYPSETLRRRQSGGGRPIGRHRPMTDTARYVERRRAG